MPTAWLRYQEQLARAAWVAGLSLLELWAAMAAGTATLLPAIPHHRTTLRLVVDHGRRLDHPIEFHR